MSPADVKSRFDTLASSVWAARQELESLFVYLTTNTDRKALRSIITDLTWATENCTVLGLHQVGESLQDNMGYPELGNQQEAEPSAAPDGDEVS